MHDPDYGRRSMALHRRAKDGQIVLHQSTDGINITQIAVAAAVGNVVGAVTNRVLFGE